MKRFRFAVCTILILAVSLGMCSCTKGEKTETTTAPSGKVTAEKKPGGSLTLPVAHNDTLDPFKVKSSVNRALVPLLYDGLVSIDENFEPQPVLISGSSNEGKTLAVELKASACFSDGSPLTASDVVFSFNNAKKCEYYQARLSGISSASASDGAVIFSLRSPDAFALACLDFPVVKEGTVQTKYKDTQLYDITPPVGTGRYRINGVLPNATLTVNPTCPRGKTPAIETINLFEISDSDGMAYGLEIGNYDFWYNDLSAGEYMRVNAGMSIVKTNSLIFLGFNSEKSILTEAPVRKALSLLLDRDLITSQGFQGHAEPSVLPFNPSWSTMKNVPVSGKTTAQTDAAKAVLEKAGYTSVNYYGYRCSTSKSLTATLTVCKDNPFKLAAAQQIKEQLAALNFHIKIVELAYKDYTEAIKKGKYEIYLGEIKIPANMSLSAFFTKGGAAYTESALHDGYFQVLSGTLSLSDFAAGFENEMPFVPVCYRCGMAVYSRSLSAKDGFTCYDNFYGIDQWTVK